MLSPALVAHSRRLPVVSGASRSHLVGRALFSARALRFYIVLVLAILVALRLFILATASTSAGAVAVMPQASTSFIRQLPLTVNDVVYSSSTQRLYASMPSSAGASGNSIVTLDPVTGAVDSPVFVGSEPKKLALSSDGNSLYVWMDGAAAIRKFDVPTKTPGLQFPLGQDNFFGSYTLTDMAVAPGNANLLAVARSYRGVSPPQAGVAVFDNRVQRPTTTPGHTIASDFLAFSASPSTLYGGGFLVALF